MTEPIFGAAIAVHRELGPGLMESVYETVLANELKHRGFRVRRQQAVKLSFAGMEFNEVFRADLIVNDTIIVELKATARFDPVFARQLLIYLRLLRLPVGLVINFGAPTIKDGVKRVINTFPASSFPRLRQRLDASMSATTSASDSHSQKYLASLRKSAAPREDF